MIKIKSLVTAFFIAITTVLAAEHETANTDQQSVATALQQAAPEVDPWIAVDPYAGRIYPKEHVSLFARAANYTATVAVMGGIAAAGGVVLYYGSDTLGYEGLQTVINAAESLEKPLLYMIVLDPTHVLAAGAYLASFPLLNLPAGVITAYTTKKGTQVAEEFAKQGWKVFKFGLDKATYVWDHLSATHLQGTLFANRHANYVAAAGTSTAATTSSTQ